MKKPPLTYYGGKQHLVAVILPLIPKHKTYTEAFFGGGAIFWAKEPSEIEVINDVSREIINFYEVLQNDFPQLEKHISISLFSRSIYNDAMVVYNNPHLFDRVKRAWAIWVLAHQSFSSKLGSGWGYDKKTKKSARAITNKRNSFSTDYSLRLQSVQIENTDALHLIRSRDHAEAFHYCDPPYFNAHCGHYSGYTLNDFENLLRTLERIEGKFLVSSYPHDVLAEYVDKNKWHTKKVTRTISVSSGTAPDRKVKTEVLTANYDLNLSR